MVVIRAILVQTLVVSFHHLRVQIGVSIYHGALTLIPAHKIIVAVSDTPFVQLLRFDVMFAVELQERAILLLRLFVLVLSATVLDYFDVVARLAAVLHQVGYILLTVALEVRCIAHLSFMDLMELKESSVIRRRLV